MTDNFKVMNDIMMSNFERMAEVLKPSPVDHSAIVKCAIEAARPAAAPTLPAEAGNIESQIALLKSLADILKKT